MLKRGPGSGIFLFIFLTLCTCIDPYSPQLKGYESLLVVDGLITNEKASYKIRLSRTIQKQDAIPSEVSDATVYITSEDGESIYLLSQGKGIYRTDSLEFTGAIGKSYVLHISTNDGIKYESDPCMMESVPDIDTVYFEKDQKLLNNGTESRDGIKIYLDSKEGDDNKYYRWDYEETWKFKVPTPKRYNYVDVGHIVPIAGIKQYCWKSRKSDEVLIHPVYSNLSRTIKREPILFIASDKSDRLMLQYSILVKQYSVSKNEYDFWDNLKKVSENGGDIFARQPYPVISNIHNVSNPTERVLGYFQVSAVKQKRIFIPFRDFVRLGLPFFHNSQCVRIEKSPSDFPWPANSPPLTFDDVYAMYCISSDYVFVEPMFNSETGGLDKLVFARPECASCELTGSPARPDFWIDL
jgi:hypothetical protein